MKPLEPVRKMKRRGRRRLAAPCAGCGRTARRMIRVREVTREVDGEGRTADPANETVRVLMVPYCWACTPAAPPGG